ncbi:MAG: hypothetical protein PVH50_12855 [Anaerolineae bacterium]|jgi:hypothetical protein
MRLRIKGTRCSHEWTEDHDPGTDAALYNAGLNYEPAFQVCTKSGRRKRIKHEPWPEWACILSFPFIVVGMRVLGVLGPLLIAMASALEALFSRRRS